MRRPVLVTAGVVAVLLGVVFTLQGVGILGGSPMTGSTIWAFIGPIIALCGIVVIVFALRGGRRG
jgi:hypothetical protein